MINHVISSARADSQSTREMDPLQGSGPERSRPASDQTPQNPLKVMAYDIRRPLLSMLATLKLLNRGYYGNMDEEAANQIRYLLSSATRLTGIVDACLGETPAGNEEEEATPNKQVLKEAKIEPLIL